MIISEGTQRVHNSLDRVAPIRTALEGVQENLQGLRSDLATLAPQEAALTATLQRLETRMAQLETQLDQTRGNIQDLTKMPEQMIDYAIASAADQAARSVADFKRCPVPD